MEHWANGGDLWRHVQSGWYIYSNEDLQFNESTETSYIIGDKHLEARKAYALGKPIEYKDIHGRWRPLGKYEPEWSHTIEYREAKPEWFELEENIGKVIMVRDRDDQEWKPMVLERYFSEKQGFRFNNVWQYARLVTDNDLAKRELQ